MDLDGVDIELETLRWFAAVAEELHFARAAQSLGVARQRLSRAVIELEEQLDTDLFVHGASPTELTDDGRALLVHARTLLDVNDAARKLQEAVVESAALRVGFTEGVTLAKWTRIWADRYPDVPLEIVATLPDTQVRSLHDNLVDVSFVRLPIDRDGLNAIVLYQEVPVVVVPKDHPVAAFDTVTVADLADEHLLQDPRDVPEWALLATELTDGSRPELPPMNSAPETFEYIAAGLGVAVVPQSIARLHSRKDLVYRPVTGVEHSPIALAWRAVDETERIDNFVGVVRGRSERSSRGVSEPAPKKKAHPSKPARKPAAAAKSSKPKGTKRSGKRR